MNFSEAEQYLLSFTDYEKTPGIAYTAANYDLRRMEQLLAPLGNPHLGTRTIHIAGTKGKGSTAAMVTSILVTAGYRTGLYTSPHLHSIRERARINDRLISEAEFASLVTEIKPIADSITPKLNFGQLTTFEILTAVVFTFFKRNKVDFQVLEVGLGGRLDATNVARGDICIITSISLDHTEILGNTEAKIATEKAGIIKPGSTVINFPQKDEVIEVIKQSCERQHARLIQLGQDITWHRMGGDLQGQSLTVNSRTEEYNLTIPLIGDFQLENAAAAVAAAEVLNNMGIKVSQNAISEGLQKVSWPGRLQVLRKNPQVLVDGAHNAYSMKKLIEAINQYFIFEKCFVIFGSSIDKDIAGMAQALANFTPNIMVTSSTHPRAASRDRVAEEFLHLGIKVHQAEDISQAIAKSWAMAAPRDLIVISGSLFVVAEAIRYFQVLS